jgi:hypothetical protein
MVEERAGIILEKEPGSPPVWVEAVASCHRFVAAALLLGERLRREGPSGMSATG